MATKVHLGSGPDIKPGWVNLDQLDDVEHPDYRNCDLRDGIPEDIEDIEMIMSSHFLEHLTYNEARVLVAHCFQRLAPGGIFRVSVPDFKKTIKAYVEDDLNWWAPLGWGGSVMQCVNESIYGAEHRCMWDARELISFLKSFGFVDVKETEHESGVDPECHLRQKYSCYVVATKPLA